MKNIYKPSAWLDVSMPIYDGMPSWPSDPKVEVTSFKDMRHGARSNVSLLKMGTHCGTHMDAPKHSFRNGEGVDAINLSQLIGPARVVSIEHPQCITATELKGCAIREGQRVLFKTRNSRRNVSKGIFVKDFIYLALDAAKYLTERRVTLIGVDYFSVGGYQHIDGVAVHRTVLSKGIAVVEGLDLSQITPGDYEMICLPLRIRHGDGAPARVVLQKLKRT